MTATFAWSDGTSEFHVVAAGVAINVPAGTTWVPTALCRASALLQSGSAELIQGLADLEHHHFTPMSRTVETVLAPAPHDDDLHIRLAQDVATALGLPGGSQVGLHVALRSVSKSRRERRLLRSARATFGGGVTAGVITLVNQAMLDQPNRVVSLIGVAAGVAAAGAIYLQREH